MNATRYLVLLVLMLSMTGCDQQQTHQSRLQEVFPPVPIKHAALNRINNLPITPAYFRDRWTWVLFGPPDCTRQCRNRLQLANRQQSAQALFVVQGLANHDQLNQLAAAFPAVAVGMSTTAASADNFNRQFEVESVSEDDKSSFFYLINPQGELAYLVTSSGLRAADLEQEIELLETANQG